MIISKITRKIFNFVTSISDTNTCKIIFICLSMFIILGSCLSSIELKEMIDSQIDSEFRAKIREEYNKQLQSNNNKLVELKKNLDMSNKKTHNLLTALINDKVLFKKYSFFIAFSIVQYQYYNYYLKKKFLSEIIKKLPDSINKNKIILILCSNALKNGDLATVRNYTAAVKRSLKATPYLKSIAEHFHFLTKKKDYSLILKLKSPDILKYYLLYQLCKTGDRSLIKSLEKFKYLPKFNAILDMQKLLLDDSGKLDLVILKKVRNELELLDSKHKQLVYDFLNRDVIKSLLVRSFFGNQSDFENRVIGILGIYESKIILTSKEINLLDSFIRSSMKKKIPVSLSDKIYYKAGNIYLKNCLFEKATKSFAKCRGDFTIPAKQKIEIINKSLSIKK